MQQLSKEGAKYLQRRDLEEARQNVKDAKRVTKAVRKELKVLKKNTAGRVDGEQTMRQVETELSLAKHWEKRAKREATRIFGEDGVLAAVIVQGGSPGIR